MVNALKAIETGYSGITDEELFPLHLGLQGRLPGGVSTERPIKKWVRSTEVKKNGNAIAIREKNVTQERVTGKSMSVGFPWQLNINRI